MGVQSQRTDDSWLPFSDSVRAAGPTCAGNRAECAVAHGTDTVARTTTTAAENEMARPSRELERAERMIR